MSEYQNEKSINIIQKYTLKRTNRILKAHNVPKHARHAIKNLLKEQFCSIKQDCRNQKLYYVFLKEKDIDEPHEPSIELMVEYAKWILKKYDNNDLHR